MIIYLTESHEIALYDNFDADTKKIRYVEGHDKLIDSVCNGGYEAAWLSGTVTIANNPWEIITAASNSFYKTKSPSFIKFETKVLFL